MLLAVLFVMTLIVDHASDRSSFKGYNQPFPIILADSLTSRDNGTQFIEPDQYVPLQNPIYEFNVCELPWLLRMVEPLD